jgi:hypothetical protein
MQFSFKCIHAFCLETLNYHLKLIDILLVALTLAALESLKIRPRILKQKYSVYDSNCVELWLNMSIMYHLLRLICQWPMKTRHNVDNAYYIN